MDKEATTSDQSEVFEHPQKEMLTEHYELLLLIVGDFTEEQARAIYDQAKDIITAAGGAVTFENPMGRRNLAYRVNGARTGTYFAVEFDLDKSQLAVVHEKMRIRKDVARFMIVKKEMFTQEEKDAYEELRAKLMNEGKEQKRQAQEEEQASMRARRPVKKEEPVASEKTEEPKAAPSKEEINQQIDKILSDNMDV